MIIVFWCMHDLNVRIFIQNKEILLIELIEIYSK